MSSASQPVLPVSPPTEHWTELSIVDRILRAADWPELKRWAEVALGPDSFELGVCYGIVQNLSSSVSALLDLLKTFILAGLYARARQGLPWWDVVGLPEYLVAKGGELVLGAELKKAHDTCEALMRQVMYVVKHPREFLKTTKDNYLRQYTQKWDLFQRLSVQTDLTSQFRAGEIFGEVLLDVLMLVMIAAGAAEAAAKLAGEVPELARLAANLKGVLKVKPGGLRVGGATGAVEELDAVAASDVNAAEIKATEPKRVEPKQIQKANLDALARQTGARELSNIDFEGAERAYDEIRRSKSDVSSISRNTGIRESRIARIKGHLFEKTHLLDDGVRRFDADPEIANAWRRLENGAHTPADIQLLEHELFESKFEGIFKTDYRTAHSAANRSGRTSGLE